MRFPRYGNYTLDISGNVLEVFATGAWNLKTAEAMVVDMQDMVRLFKGAPWAALMDGRRWVLSTPECQNCLSNAIKFNIEHGLKRAAYVLDPGMIKRAQLERTHPSGDQTFDVGDYQREYFTTYFSALNWLADQGFKP
ncbi:hypothetical protein [Alteromonas halophila]|uniref:Uncharacterized protein n=1 Tax=Alteromonas halophila TaxID=516698 RepID=A0A918MX09_9ALTE|nr:hypothetical protein [Alteromonas halophila]GGW79390.1 hypothetical protein GCM10007391_10190 [Alteromonas halophila]